MLERSIAMNKDTYIKNGRIYNISISEYFNVRLSDDENPSICPNIVIDDMPVSIAKKLIHESLKVRGRPTMKKMDVETLKKVYKGDISWRVLFNKEGAEIYKSQVSMSNSELDNEIARLTALKASQPKDDFDKDIENLEMENDTEVEDVTEKVDFTEE
jgi:hypothetical protein